MAGGWRNIADAQSRYKGAGTIEAGGDVEEFAADVYGMIIWLADRASYYMGQSRQQVIEQAERHAKRGMQLGGRSDGDDEES